MKTIKNHNHRNAHTALVNGLVASLGLLALATPGLGQSFIRPIEADFHGSVPYTLITDAGLPGVAGTGGVYLQDLALLLWSYAPTSGPGALKDPSAAEALGNGEVAIADKGNHRVLIVNQAGQITWNSANVTFSDGKLIRGPVDVQIIPDGTPSMADNPILITCQGNNRVAAVKRTGQVVWAMNAGLSAPLKAERLPNGNTLICESQRVIEVNAAKLTVLNIDSANHEQSPQFTDAERLADGSTLILDAANGVLLQFMPGQAEPFIRPIDFDLTGATDVDGIHDLAILFTAPAGVIQQAWPDDWEMPW